MKKLIGILCSIVLMTTSIYAQIDKEKAIKPRHELKIADLLYAQSHYYSAAEYYKEVIRVKPDKRYAKYWLAMSTLKAHDYENAVKYFSGFDKHPIDPKAKTKRIEKENNEIFGLANYYYGVALKQNGDSEGAIERLKEFKGKYSMPDKEDWMKVASNEIAGAEWAIANPDTKKVKIKSLGDAINTGYEDAAPMPINDSTLYYTSLQEDQLVFIKNKKDIPQYNLYQSKKVDGVWQRGQKLPTMFQDEKFGTGNSALSEDGNRMYFCKCFNNEVDEIICNLFMSEKKKDRWQEPFALNESINSPKYTSTQPAVRTSGDGMDIVYFVSDREEGKGGMDIWYFIRTARGDFKGPRLLGGTINTPQDEMTPYYDNTENLFYFSSNGHPSTGGFDVFVSYEDEDLGWVEPENVGLPINSPADDLYYVKEPGKTSGFLVSNREGTSKIRNRYTGDDIFYFEDFKYGLEGFVFKEDENGNVPLEGARVRLYTTDAYGNEVMVEELIDVKEDYYFNLKPDKEYKVEVVKLGFTSSFEYVSTMDIPYEDTLSRNLGVNKTQIDALGSLYDDKDSLKTNKLDNAILTLFEIGPNGEKRTISTKKMGFGVTDFSFTLDIEKEYLIEVTKDGYFKRSIPVLTSGIPDEKEFLDVTALLSAIEVGKSYELANILYDFGKSSLRDESKVVLDELIALLQENPSIIIELGSHTDAIGSDVSNLKLSQARAQSCVNHMISKGISKDRVSAKGYGESSPVAPNENEDGSDNEEGRQKNRRTEFKVLESF
ncbi:MAG: outer membrane protein OmpA-like peptidoglycan-associated protein [Chitinophagales bacterium]|jgi:outer membrane protein OmpA-like peptidoglycan-associated protein/tetratricopeptide (TPR) repeat protein